MKSDIQIVLPIWWIVLLRLGMKLGVDLPLNINSTLQSVTESFTLHYTGPLTIGPLGWTLLFVQVKSDWPPEPSWDWDWSVLETGHKRVWLSVNRRIDSVTIPLALSVK